MDIKTYKLQDALALRAPAPAWKYVAVLPELSNTNPLETTANAQGYNNISSPKAKFSSKASLPGILVESFEVSHVGINSVQRFYSARTINFPGRLSVSSFTINFYETDTYQVTDYLSLWRNNVVNDNANFGLPRDYKKDVFLFAFDFQGNNTAKFILSGVYPENVQAYSYDGTSSDRLKVGCTFSVDFSVFVKGRASSSTNEFKVVSLDDSLAKARKGYNQFMNMFT